MAETIAVSEFLREGENRIVVTLGDGWWRGSMGHSQERNVYGTDVALLAQLEIAAEPVLVTDESWQATQEGALGKNDFMAGEEYDATREELCNLHEVKTENFGFDNLICYLCVVITNNDSLDDRNEDKTLGRAFGKRHAHISPLRQHDGKLTRREDKVQTDC